jgi:competence protein ComEA
MQRAGIILCVVLLLAYFAVQSRHASVNQQGPPAFFVESAGGARVAFRDGFAVPGVRQFVDVTSPRDAIELAIGQTLVDAAEAREFDAPLQDGESFDILLSGPQLLELRRYWMPAQWRMAFGIPLHPDRMDEQDWQALPGIGPKLAASIELDRQNNGDFVEYNRLQRVRGIGPKRLRDWEKYFSSTLTGQKFTVKFRD